jgi:SAM-dependent methyltransferase
VDNTRRKFSFGENWLSYQEYLNETRLRDAQNDIEEWIGKNNIKGKTIVDIGCGSGVHSFSLFKMGARRIVSIDVDPKSVEATKKMHAGAGSPHGWTIHDGSILDDNFIKTLPVRTFDIVYSWGVLHHTGSMWKAIEKSIQMIKPGGVYWIALYVKGPRYAADLALKTKYNGASNFWKKVMVRKYIFRIIVKHLIYLNIRSAVKALFPKSYDVGRGMNLYHDVVDWLGGLPYEVASAGEVVEFTRKFGLILEKLTLAPEGGCNIFLFSKPKSITGKK